MKVKTADNKKLFILDVDDFPSWFVDEASKGRAKIKYDEENEIESVKILSGTKTYEAVPGDTIMKLSTGMVVIKQDKAKKFINEGTKKEEKENV